MSDERPWLHQRTVHIPETGRVVERPIVGVDTSPEAREQMREAVGDIVTNSDDPCVRGTTSYCVEHTWPNCLCGNRADRILDTLFGEVGGSAAGPRSKDTAQQVGPSVKDPTVEPTPDVLARLAEVFYCPECKAAGAADEDGCCTTCGADCEIRPGRIVATVETTPDVEARLAEVDKRAMMAAQTVDAIQPLYVIYRDALHEALTENAELREYPWPQVDELIVENRELRAEVERLTVEVDVADTLKMQAVEQMQAEVERLKRLYEAAQGAEQLMSDRMHAAEEQTLERRRERDAALERAEKAERDAAYWRGARKGNVTHEARLRSRVAELEGALRDVDNAVARIVSRAILNQTEGGDG